MRRGEDWLPRSIEVEGKDIPLMNFETLEQQSARILLLRARSIRDKLGADRLPQLVPGTVEVLIKWLLTVQCALCSQMTGMAVTPADFGAPEEYADYVVPQATQATPSSQQKWGDMHGMIDHNSGLNAKACFA